MDKKIVTDFKPQSGKHCITNSLKCLFNHNGIHISEDMIFGMGSGINFFYFEFNNEPIVGGRTKVIEFEDKLSENMQVAINITETTSIKKAHKQLIDYISNNTPVMIYVDMFYINYLKQVGHFGGHAINVFGFDDEEEVFVVSDRDGVGVKVTLSPDEDPKDFHHIQYSELRDARNSKFKPFPAKNRCITIDSLNYTDISEQQIIKAIHQSANQMINAPLRNLGVSAIKLFADKIITWKNFDKEKFQNTCITNFAMINEIGGTGGGAFRDMYSTFLHEVSERLKSTSTEKIGDSYKQISVEWDNVADILFETAHNCNYSNLDKASDKIRKLYIQESKAVQQLLLVTAKEKVN